MLNIQFSSFVCELMIGTIIGLIVSMFNGFGKKLKEPKKDRNEWRKADFHLGDVVQTKDGHDRGLVTMVDKNNMPTEVMASPSLNMRTGKHTEISYYGGVTSVKWYKTGEHMTTHDWNELYSGENGIQRYYEDRRNQIKLVV